MVNKKKWYRDEEFNDIEETIYGCIYGDIEILSKYFSNLKSMISPDISKIVNEFDLNSNNQLKNTNNMFSLGMLNGHFCVNARTQESHTECDSSYTIISVPVQQYDGYKKLNARFKFVINQNTDIIIPMQPKVAFLYSGYMLSHHQILDSIDQKQGIFINLATYGNKRLFDNMMKSLHRTF